jgi:hypothetical protein
MAAGSNAYSGSGPPAIQTGPRPQIHSPAGDGITRIARWSFVPLGLVLALVAPYLVIVTISWLDVDSPPLTWARRTALLGGLQAIAFAGVGALFATALLRGLVRKAEQEATEAREDADRERQHAESNRLAAEKGRALQMMAATRVQRVPARFRAAAVSSVASEFQELVDLAQRYDADRTP